MSNLPELTINTHVINASSPCYIIAEMSANHGGNLDRAIEILVQAKAAGADAVKLQTYRADTITLNCEKPDFLLPSDSPWQSHVSLYSLYEKAYTPWEWHKALFDKARELDLDIFSSPFDDTAVDLLEELNAPAYKIASPEITDIPLLIKVAKTGKPVILSTGIAELTDIELAVTTLREHGCKELAILKCTTAYPTPFSECNLSTIKDIATRFNCVAGLSDHTLGLVAPITSIALGAKIIEKHFILNSDDESVDAFFSLNQSEFNELVVAVRNAEAAIGQVNYTITKSAQQNLLARRSLYFSNSLNVGDEITKDDIKSVRPGFGLHTKYYSEIIGRRVTENVEAGDRVTLKLVEGLVEES